jgi:hypothetical protein
MIFSHYFFRINSNQQSAQVIVHIILSAVYVKLCSVTEEKNFSLLEKKNIDETPHQRIRDMMI